MGAPFFPPSPSSLSHRQQDKFTLTTLCELKILDRKDASVSLEYPKLKFQFPLY